MLFTTEAPLANVGQSSYTEEKADFEISGHAFMMQRQIGRSRQQQADSGNTSLLYSSFRHSKRY